MPRRFVNGTERRVALDLTACCIRYPKCQFYGAFLIRDKGDGHVLSVRPKLPTKPDELIVQGDKNTRAGAVCHCSLLSVWIHRTFFEDLEHIEFLPWDPLGTKIFFYRKHLETLPEEYHIKYGRRWVEGGFDEYDYLN